MPNRKYPKFHSKIIPHSAPGHLRLPARIWYVLWNKKNPNKSKKKKNMPHSCEHPPLVLKWRESAPHAQVSSCVPCWNHAGTRQLSQCSMTSVESGGMTNNIPRHKNRQNAVNARRCKWGVDVSQTSVFIFKINGIFLPGSTMHVSELNESKASGFLSPLMSPPPPSLDYRHLIHFHAIAPIIGQIGL